MSGKSVLLFPTAGCCFFYSPTVSNIMCEECLPAAILKGSCAVPLAFPGVQVSWEFWTNSNDQCGPVCDVQKEFIKEMVPVAKVGLCNGLCESY